jgi:hypothetical protein
MASYSFKSVGKTKQQKEKEVLEESPIPFGIKTPLQLGTGTILEMNYDLADQFQDNLKNLLLTNWGERLGLYDFGANLRPLTTEYSSQEDFDNEAIERIRNAVEKWMPFIDLEDFSSSFEKVENKSGGLGIIKLTITYNISALNVFKKAVQVLFYVI